MRDCVFKIRHKVYGFFFGLSTPTQKKPFSKLMGYESYYDHKRKSETYESPKRTKRKSETYESPKRKSETKVRNESPKAQADSCLEMTSRAGGAGGTDAPQQGAEVHAVAAQGLTDVFPPLQFPDQTPIWDGAQVVPDG